MGKYGRRCTKIRKFLFFYLSFYLSLRLACYIYISLLVSLTYLIFIPTTYRPFFWPSVKPRSLLCELIRPFLSGQDPLPLKRLQHPKRLPETSHLLFVLHGGTCGNFELRNTLRSRVRTRLVSPVQSGDIIQLIKIMVHFVSFVPLL